MLILDSIIYSLQRHGGISVYFNELLKRLSGVNVAHRPIFFTPMSDQISLNSGCAEYRTARLAERYRKCLIPEDALLFHSSYYRLPNKSVPTVTTVHDFTYERFSKGLPKFIHSRQKFNAIRNSQEIICISDNTKSDLLEFLPSFDPARVHVIHNGVGDIFSPINFMPNASLDRPYVLFVGARNGYKNFLTVVGALKLIPDLKLISVGGGTLSDYERAEVESSLPNRFEHRSHVSDESLNQLYNEAFCLAYPSAYEGFGIPVLEAMRAGCPVIAVNNSSIPEVAGNAALLLDKPDVNELVNAFQMLQNNDLRTLLRKKGFEQASHFSWQKTFEMTLHVYEIASGFNLRN